MTRLIEIDIKDIPKDLLVYEAELNAKTSCSLLQIACHAMGVTEKTVKKSLQNVRVGVIPITTGLGRLQGFCEAVAAIASFIGCQADISQQTDMAGFSATIASGADIIMMADEQRFVALNLNTRKIADNAVATGRGFVTALRLMTGSALLYGRVLVLGCGPVGMSAVKILLEYECHVSVYDLDPRKSVLLLETCESGSNGFIQRTDDLESALQNHNYIVDASPAREIIHTRHIKADTMISAPGMPLGLDHAAQIALGSRLIHDPLQIGVATMLIESLV